jgi:hypothetical protein
MGSENQENFLAKPIRRNHALKTKDDFIEDYGNKYSSVLGQRTLKREVVGSNSTISSCYIALFEIY